MSLGISRFGCACFIILLYCVSFGLTAEIPGPEPTKQQLLSGKPFIYTLKPERQGGRGYKLVYLVDAPLFAYWKFKTDFDNEFLLSNKLITSHRLISRNGNVIVTETIYSNKPNTVFRWQTSVFPERNLLKFILLNPDECGQEYHYGYIQMEAFGDKTKIIQVAYFKFFGMSVWVNYPFYGGMNYMLNYLAGWEQQTILELKDKYGE